MASTTETTIQVKRLYPFQSFPSQDIISATLIIQIVTITGAPLAMCRKCASFT